MSADGGDDQLVHLTSPLTPESRVVLESDGMVRALFACVIKVCSCVCARARSLCARRAASATIDSAAGKRFDFANQAAAAAASSQCVCHSAPRNGSRRDAFGSQQSESEQHVVDVT